MVCLCYLLFICVCRLCVVWVADVGFGLTLFYCLCLVCDLICSGCWFVDLFSGCWCEFGGLVDYLAYYW